MDRYVITGKQKLQGTIQASGAKNAALPLMAAAILAEGETVISGIPQLTDIDSMAVVLRQLGCRAERQGDIWLINTDAMDKWTVEEALMRKMRASNLILGPILARRGKVRMSQPGGCPIGSRPMDQHLKGLEVLGVTIEEKHGYIEAWADHLTGGEIYLDVPSVGATENLMMAAVLAQGVTVINNAAREPEIVDLQNILNKMGAKIRGAGTHSMRIDGVKRLQGAEHAVIPDRIEAGTHMIAAAMTEGDVVVENVVPEHISPVIAKLKQAGADVQVENDKVRVRRQGPLKAVDIKTLAYPGFPTDMQPQFMAMLTMAAGTSIVSETIFENRFQHVAELRRMGAKITVEGRSAVVTGNCHLEGAFVEASDLRAGAALFLAALAAEEGTVLGKIEHIDRGYEKLEEKYRNLGAKVQRMVKTI